MLLRFHRSDEWVAAQRLERGANVQNDAEVELDIPSLTKEARAILLAAGHGKYQNYVSWLKCDADGAIVYSERTSGYRSAVQFALDADSEAVTPADASAVICEAAERLRTEQAAKREEAEAKQAERARAEAEKVAARELLAGEIERHRQQIRDLTAARDDLMLHRETLTVLLRAVPLDALRGAVRRLVEAQTEAGEADIFEQIDTAATERIFDRDDVDND